jgi:hypothetical protein
LGPPPPPPDPPILPVVSESAAFAKVTGLHMPLQASSKDQEDVDWSAISIRPPLDVTTAVSPTFNNSTQCRPRKHELGRP